KRAKELARQDAFPTDPPRKEQLQGPLRPLEWYRVRRDSERHDGHDELQEGREEHEDQVGPILVDRAGLRYAIRRIGLAIVQVRDLDEVLALPDRRDEESVLVRVAGKVAINGDIHPGARIAVDRHDMEGQETPRAAGAGVPAGH